MSTLNKQFWEERYHTGETGWDIGYVSTPLKNYFDRLNDRTIRILIPGGGNAWEAEYLFQQGFTDVTLLDIAGAPLEAFRKRVTDFPESKLICEDFFAHNGEYDLIVEQTFFCALNPALRSAYAAKVHQLLRPGGKWVGVLFNITFPHDGPPFGGCREEYLPLFEPLFDLKVFDPCHNSIPPRAGNELFVIGIKK